MSEQLYNKKSKNELIEQLHNEDFSRLTLSFYKYIEINNTEDLRNKIYRDLSSMKILGRIYIAKEGVNAQISIPIHHLDNLMNYINSENILKDAKIKGAVEDGESFYKLKIKVKDEIVAYGIDRSEYDMNNVGKHLSPEEFNRTIEDANCTIVDIRNHYESEVGHFENAILPDVDRSQELLPEVKKMLKGKEKEKILLYCTGGIRCEKASSYLIKNNFKDVNQLDGGVINYANQVKKKKIKSKYIGKNFVFDNRLGERITSDIISSCHQCQNKSDSHTNCANDLCHLLFIQCETCQLKYNGCCSKECSNYLALSDDDKINEKEKFLDYNERRLKGKVKPKLYEIIN
tara:strand:+ start:1854 stop:2891 length:1038 start_codon:yes stop_codon:yes gene_type:complete